MQPCSLLLEGFVGITSGLNKDSIYIDFESIPDETKLVAIVGPNGSGKTTIIDNMHPYRVMPSKVSKKEFAIKPSLFSFWDELSGLNSKKIFIWIHNSIKYKSEFVFKRTGKTDKADYYLSVFDDVTENWEPYVSSKGSISDGKALTYDECVEAILGSSEFFFLAHFSAQGRNGFADQKSTSIKSLFSEFLQLDEFLQISRSAMDVCKLLRSELQDAHDEKSLLNDSDQKLNLTIESFNQTQIEIKTAKDLITAAEKKHANRLANLVELITKQKADLQSNDRIFLTEQIAFLRNQNTQDLDKIKIRYESDLKQINYLIQTYQSEISKADLALNKIQIDLNGIKNLKVQRSIIENAVSELVKCNADKETIDKAIIELEPKLLHLANLRKNVQMKTDLKEKLSFQGEEKNKSVSRLKETAQLVSVVPCAGTQWQTDCSLLCQANKAHAQAEIEEKEVFQLFDQFKLARQELNVLRKELADTESVESSFQILDSKSRSLQEKMSRLNIVVSKKHEVEDLDKKENLLNESILQFQKQKSDANANLEVVIQKRKALETELNSEIDLIKQSSSAQLKVFEEKLNALAKPISDEEIISVQNEVSKLLSEVEYSKEKLMQLLSQSAKLDSQVEKLKRDLKRLSEVKEKISFLDNCIAQYSLIAKGCGNNGVVALSIDDAGPAIAQHTNAILEACYGGRFAVRIDTQKEDSNGQAKETFEVIVFDNHCGGEKPLSKMSDGQKIWVDICLARSIALHVSLSGGTLSKTIFSDESDGALDPENKRNFMKMKTEVLARGGYHREYFISHTPELTELADYKIEVLSL